MPINTESLKNVPEKVPNETGGFHFEGHRSEERV